jgi:hypothetical protein
MFLMFNAQERTVKEFSELFRKTGWKLTAVRRTPGDSSLLQVLEAVPI